MNLDALTERARYDRGASDLPPTVTVADLDALAAAAEWANEPGQDATHAAAQHALVGALAVRLDARERDAQALGAHILALAALLADEGHLDPYARRIIGAAVLEHLDSLPPDTSTEYLRLPPGARRYLDTDEG